MEEKDRWVLPYANLFSILMILFLILFVFAYAGSRFSYERTLLAMEEALGRNRKTEIILLETSEKLDRYISAKGLKKFIQLEVLPDRIKIVLLNPILFEIGSAELKPLPFFEELRDMLKIIPNKIRIEGHTCDLPISSVSKYRSNLELSGARAFSVLKYMLDGGLQPERFIAMGCGENIPLVPNDNEENRKLNRRVEISIIRE